jgi:hypothetical protein
MFVQKTTFLPQPEIGPNFSESGEQSVSDVALVGIYEPSCVLKVAMCRSVG